MRGQFPLPFPYPFDAVRNCPASIHHASPLARTPIPISRNMLGCPQRRCPNCVPNPTNSSPPTSQRAILGAICRADSLFREEEARSSRFAPGSWRSSEGGRAHNSSTKTMKAASSNRGALHGTPIKPLPTRTLPPNSPIAPSAHRVAVNPVPAVSVSPSRRPALRAALSPANSRSVDVSQPRATPSSASTTTFRIHSRGIATVTTASANGATQATMLGASPPSASCASLHPCASVNIVRQAPTAPSSKPSPNPCPPANGVFIGIEAKSASRGIQPAAKRYVAGVHPPSTSASFAFRRGASSRLHTHATRPIANALKYKLRSIFGYPPSGDKRNHRKSRPIPFKQVQIISTGTL